MVALVVLWCGDGEGDEVVRRWWRWGMTCVGRVVFASAAGNLVKRDGGTGKLIINAVSSKLMLFGLTIDHVHLMLLGHKGSLEESQAQDYHLDLEHAQKVLSMQETDVAEPAEVEELLEVVTVAKLMTKVVTTATTTITVALVPKASALRRRRGVIIQDPEEAATASLSVQSEVKSKDKGKGILVEEPKPLKRQEQIEQDEAFAKELEGELNANINWNKVIEQESKESKRKSESFEQKEAKKQRINKEVEDLKTHLQIVPNDEDDVYTEATPLALKVPIVDYQIHTEHNKPYYKIIRADGTHQLFLSFIIVLRKFDREDLEMLWKIAQERFESLITLPVETLYRTKKAVLTLSQITLAVETCGRPSDTHVCYPCTCEKCGIILSYGTCLNCNSRTGNSFTYDPIPESFDEVQISLNPPPQYHFNIYLCQICESNSHYSYECSQRVPLVYEPKPCYTQNFSDNVYSHDLPDAHIGYSFPAQVPSFQTLPSFPQQYPCCEICEVLPEADHCQPPQYTVNHLIFNAHNDLLSSRPTHMEQMEQLASMYEMVCQIIQKKQEEKKIKEEQAAKYWKIPTCYDDDEDYNFAITPNEPIDSLSMGEEHLDTVPTTKLKEFIKSSVENLVPNPKKIFSNPLFKEEINSMKIDPHHFNAESDLIESLLNHDSSIISSSSKIDFLLDEFVGELTLLKSIPLRIDKTDCHPENEIRLTERLLYDNSSPRPPEEFVSENSNADIESFSPSPILVEDSDSFMEEIDLSFNPDDPMPPSIKEDDYDSERDIIILEELPSNYSLSLPKNESFYFDIPSFSRPPAKPPDGNTGILNVKMMGDIFEQKVPMPRLMITLVPNQEKSSDLLSHRGFKIF
uniref:Uncharacterized protein n=1 Tax=Tanacetum cinerariifolium TaxID=118510 RepID=A0A699GZ33_TANCI|nr:hypothetical protein [Tanacetum cinerariifolium]